VKDGHDRAVMAGTMRREMSHNYFTEMCSGSEEGSYLRRIVCVYHSTLGLRVIKKMRNKTVGAVSYERGTPLIVFDTKNKQVQ